MTFGVQFTGSVTAGQTATWFTHSWNAANTVVWTVVPTGPAVDGNAQLEWKVRCTRQAANLLKWFIEDQERHQRDGAVRGALRDLELRSAA